MQRIIQHRISQIPRHTTKIATCQNTKIKILQFHQTTGTNMRIGLQRGERPDLTNPQNTSPRHQPESTVWGWQEGEAGRNRLTSPNHPALTPIEAILSGEVFSGLAPQSSLPGKGALRLAQSPQPGCLKHNARTRPAKPKRKNKGRPDRGATTAVHRNLAETGMEVKEV